MFVTKSRELLMELAARLHTIETALVVMDPKVSTSADAYDGLRKQVIASMNSRRAHLVQLAHFSRAVARGANIDDLRGLIDEWMQQAGLVAVSDTRDPGLYDVLEGRPGEGALEVLSPAYADASTGSLVMSGQGRWVKDRDDFDEGSAEMVTRSFESSPAAEKTEDDKEALA